MFVIVIDPGHGQNANKGICAGYYEGNQMFKLAQHLITELKQYENVRVKTTRTVLSDDPSLQTRGLLATGANLLLSLHSNAPGTTNSSIFGVEIYDSFERRNKPLAQAMLDVIVKTMQSKSRGVKYRENTNAGRKGQDWYGVLRNAVHEAGCPSAMLIEHGFHTNQAECTWLMNDNNLTALAKAEAEVIAKHYALVKKGGQPVSRVLSQTSPTMKGEDVKEFQRAANTLINAGLDVDGSYGPASVKAARDLQAFLKVAVDGKVGPATWAAIHKALSETGSSAEDKKKIAQLEAQVAQLQKELMFAEDALVTAQKEVDRLNKVIVSIRQAVALFKSL